MPYGDRGKRDVPLFQNGKTPAKFFSPETLIIIVKFLIANIY